MSRCFFYSEMPGWRFISWKTLSILLTIVLGLAVNYVSWLRTRDCTEITFRLKDWRLIGIMWENELDDLELTYNSKSVKNILKVSWEVVNTGTTGISGFETPPLILYPRRLNIAEARISETSPLLKIGERIRIDSERGIIEIGSIGILNPGDFFQVDVYMLDIPTSIVSAEYFSDWKLIAKSVDLKVKRGVSENMISEKRGGERMLSKF